MHTRISRVWPLLLLAALLLAPTHLHATNGMYLTAYGAETLGRGGASSREITSRPTCRFWFLL
jgi:hypothetical protein